MTRQFIVSVASLLLATHAWAQAPADNQLPPISALPAAAPALPATSAPAVAVPPVAVAAPTDMAAPAETSGTASSIGKSTVSLFFTGAQMHALREALTLAESHGADTNSNAPLEITTSEPKKVTEPTVYPVFYLSSIAYHGPQDWSIWVSGHKITSNKNTTSLQVVSVSADRASFIWKPDYADALATRYTNHLFATATSVQNKMTLPQTFHYEPKNGSVSFSLLSNQSFVPAYMGTYEGLIDSPGLPPLPTGKDDKDKEAAAAAAMAENNLLMQKANPPSNEQPLHKNEGLADDSINALINRVKH